MKKREKAGFRSVNAEPMMLISMTKTIAAPAPESRFLAKARVLVRFPSGSKFSVGAKTMTMPVNALSNSSIVTFTLPRAGSLM